MRKYLAKGIDISHWNGDINFKTVAANGINFVIIKAGGNENKRYKDKCFENYYQKAKEAGIDVGAYYFAGKDFQGKDKGILDAYHFLELIRGKKFEYPLCLDIEAQPVEKRSETTTAAISFCEELENAGYYASIYSSDVLGFQNILDDSRLNAYDHWVARWGKYPTRVKKFGMWQATSEAEIVGIRGNVDVDYAYINYPLTMKKVGLNGYMKGESK